MTRRATISTKCLQALEAAIAAYRAGYAEYYERCKHDNSPAMRDPNAVVYLIPGVGMITFARDKATARISGEFYVNAINVMRGASTVSTYVGLPEQEAFDIEYWLLEEAKLQRMPKPKSLAGRVALCHRRRRRHRLGDGRAPDRRGRRRVLADIDQTALDDDGRGFRQALRQGHVRGVKLNVTDEARVIASYVETQRAIWRRRHPRLECRHRFVGSDRGHDAGDLGQEHRHPRDRLFPRLARGIPPVPAPEARRQSSSSSRRRTASPHRRTPPPIAPPRRPRSISPAAWRWRVRKLGIRVNTVNPDAVLRGSKIWQGEWREQRAASSTRSARTISRSITASVRC